MNVQSGGVVSSTDSYLAVASGSAGTATVTGAGSQWNSTSLDIGGGSSASGGAGSLTVSNSGLVSVTGATKLWNAGTLTLSGGSFTTGSFDRSLGTLNLNDGTLTVNAGVLKQAAGRLSSAVIRPRTTHPLALSGNTTTTSGIQSVVIGNTNQGALSISGGAVLSNPGNATALSTTYGGTTVYSGQGYLGLNAASSGTATISGTGSQWNNGDALLVGYTGNGTLNVQSGGVVSNENAYLGYDTGTDGHRDDHGLARTMEQPRNARWHSWHGHA